MKKNILNINNLCNDFILVPSNFFFYNVLLKVFLLFNIKIKTYIVLLNQKNMFFLNKKYRNKNFVTDVLSFPNSYLYKNISLDFLGEIIFCPLEIYNRSIKKKIKYLVYFSYLLIHSFLHLLNFNHIKYSDYKIMFLLEDYFMYKFWNKNNLKFI